MDGYAYAFRTYEEYGENKTNIEFITQPDIRRPRLSDNRSFYIVFSPEKYKLKLRDST